jgi:S-adenosylmethionine:tRNA ribosyltransferase-isomerase
MNRQELFFDLPKELIAQEPAQPRDQAKLMVLDRLKQTIEHDRFFHLGQYLKAGDLLVMNQSKVLPARLFGKRDGEHREVLLLKEEAPGDWEVLVGGKVKIGDRIVFSNNLSCIIEERRDATFLARFSLIGPDFLQTLEVIGKVPTPPYIKKVLREADLYQTVYAKDLGSAAAPTAGLHFTKDLMLDLLKKGVQQEFVTLHVGLGTFQPIKSEKVEDHQIHSEWFSVSRDVYNKVRLAKKEGRRIIAVGTTSVRVLETIFQEDFPIPPEGEIKGETNIFIYPGYEWKVIDALITNFHTPYSSLLALVFSFGGQEYIKKAYQEAIGKKYRFFSFGDAMFIY